MWVAIAIPCLASVAAEQPDDRYNVLFISVDDLNDWIGPMDGNSQALTPNLDRFADEGAMVFHNAHCPGPVCGPSRSAILSGFMPNRSGIYTNRDHMLDAELVELHPTLPEYFSMHGYVTVSKGKIFHAHMVDDGMDYGQWAFENWEPRADGDEPDPARLTSRNRNLFHGKPLTGDVGKAEGSEFAWGPTLDPLEETEDYQVAQWARAQLERKWNRPFFMAIGLFRPHLPFFVPQEFFDLYPIDEIELPPHRLDDLDDILNSHGEPKFGQTADFRWVNQRPEIFRSAVQAYLACTTYADTCLGVILDALDSSEYRDNTIVVIWGDHGWHLGEKLRFRKATLWRESTRVPFLIRLPSMESQLDNDHPVNLIDLYRTLIDLCDLPPNDTIDGHSLFPLLQDPESRVRDASLTIWQENQVSIQTDRWHYIRYADGSEELYDVRSDPYEFKNLIHVSSKDHGRLLRRLRSYLPQEMAAPMNGERKPPKWGVISPTVGRDRWFTAEP
ncbi:MAG: sulfatase-like hydrolase/transferase [Verrucomicrobia bacterium]|nr:sulfatase-like hydrolase/transferase [Verrucomicrobiota bacterium]